MAFPHTEDTGLQAGCAQDKGQDRGDPFICGTQTGKRASLTKMRFQPQGHRQNREHSGARAVISRHGCCLAPQGKSGLCRCKAHRPAPYQAVMRSRRHSGSGRRRRYQLPNPALHCLPLPPRAICSAS